MVPVHGSLSISVGQLSAAGTSKFEMESWAKVFELKERVRQELGIAEYCQHLVLGNTVLGGNYATLAECGMHPWNAALTVVQTRPHVAVICFQHIANSDTFNKDFDLRHALLGRVGENFQHIAKHAGCLIQLRGQGSLTLERHTFRELDEPLFIWLQQASYKTLESSAVHMVRDLLVAVFQDYETFLFVTRRPPLRTDELEHTVHIEVEDPSLAMPGMTRTRLWHGARHLCRGPVSKQNANAKAMKKSARANKKARVMRVAPQQQ